jgi:hypothetical protein
MAQDFSQARIVAQKWLSTESLPPFAIEELNHLLEDIQINSIEQNTLDRLLPNGQFRDQANLRPREVI